jgi:UDP-N-acetylmuramate dehydrogenase
MAPRLATLTTLRLGGAPARYVEAASERDVVVAVREADRAGEPVLVLGGGSNLVVADGDLAATVIRIITNGVTATDQGDRVRLSVQAGEDWDGLVARCVADGLAGIECLAAIPGSVGATPIQNVGAYGQDVSEAIVAVRVYDRATDTISEFAPADCGFAYRSSVFKRTPGRWVVLAVTLTLPKRTMSGPLRYAELTRKLERPLGGTAPITDVRDAVLTLRRAKGMVVDPRDPDSVSAGSFFTNPVLSEADFAVLLQRVGDDAERLPRFPAEPGTVKTSAAWLIERAGFRKGYGDPSTVAISSKHTLALTNRGEGTAAQLVALAREIADGVENRFGVRLVPEPVLVGLSWTAADARAPSARPRA